MTNKNLYILIIALVQSAFSIGQNDSIHLLEEVVLSDIRLYQDSQDRLQVFSDSVLTQNPVFLTDLLRSNTFLHFREYGPGMVSSVSFRGTSASQTAVVWNGININSSLNGQTDFNTLVASHYDHIALRTGGGSLIYGSGAMGGSIHLNNHLSFNSRSDHQAIIRYGSFNTYFGSYKGSYSSDKTAIQLSLSRYGSDNDFPYPAFEGRNQNGDFLNTGINLSLGQRVGEKHVFKLFSHYSFGDRGFSGTLATTSNSMMGEENSRNLVEWNSFYRQLTTSLKLAYLDELYQYHENRNNHNYDYGRARSIIAKYDLKYTLNSTSELSGILDLQHTSGEGSNIGEEKRATGALGVLYKQEWERFRYGLGLRQEISSVYRSPLLFSVNTGYSLSDWYSLGVNFSKNYRVPTFNDLFWSAGGNTDLEPETSLQGELTQRIEYKSFDFRLTGFVIQIQDLLRWVPDDSGIWKAENTRSVRNYGAEFILDWHTKLGHHKVMNSNSYAYTHSTDLDLEKDLVYVPRHKFTTSLVYNWKRLNAFYQMSYTGRTYTSSDNNYWLDAYTLANAGVNYSLSDQEMVRLGLEVRNLWNASYFSQPSRPMPGTSFTGTLILKF